MTRCDGRRDLLTSWCGIAGLFGSHRSPAYAQLASACAVDPRFAGISPPLPVLHAVRLAALQGRAKDPWEGDVDAFAHDVQALSNEVTAAVNRNIVQFTEPLRMADLLPGLLFAAERYPGRPLRLIDIGACAGLHLVPECYTVRYPRGVWSQAAATLTLDSPLDVPPRLLELELGIIDRVGIDLSPVDPAAPETANYLRSFAWAGDPAREVRLLKALAMIAPRTSSAPTPCTPNPCTPKILAGNAATLLPGLLERYVSRDTVTVVIDSAVSHYLSGLDALRLSRVLDRMAVRGPLMMIARGGTIPNSADLPSSVRVVDLSRQWRMIYAASDLLSERMQWVGPRE